MTVYLFLIGIPVLYFLKGYSSGKREKTNRNTIIIFFIGMILLVWLRSPNIGTDTADYLAMYTRAKNYGFHNLLNVYKGEYGYFALNMIIAKVYDNEQFFLLCIALLSLLPVMVYYSKKSENALITIGLFSFFLFPMYFAGMRQICAMALVFPAYYSVKEKKILIFILCVITATLFHTSAFIIALLYPVYYLKIRKIWFIFLIPTLLVTYAYRMQIFSFLLRFMSERYQELYTEFSKTSAIMVLLLLILLVVFTYITADATLLDEEAIGLRNLLVLSMVLQMFASINSTAMRINYYFLLFVPVTMSKYVHYSNKQYSELVKLAEYVLTVFFTVYFVWDLFTGADALNIVPYEFYFIHNIS